MHKLQIPDAEIMIMALRDEIARSEESRYDHRLHGVLLVCSGRSCYEVAELFGHSPRTVEYWVRRFERSGFAGLQEGERPGDPPHWMRVRVSGSARICAAPHASAVMARRCGTVSCSAIICRRVTGCGSACANANASSASSASDGASHVP